MKTKIVLTAMVAVIMALAFLPGAYAQESAVTQPRAQEEPVEEAEETIEELMALLPEDLQPAANEMVSQLKKLGILAIVAPVFNFFWAFIGPIFFMVLSWIPAGLLAAITPLWAGLNDIDLGSYLWQSLKIIILMFIPLVYPIYLFVHYMRHFGNLIPPFRVVHGIEQLVLLWSNLGVKSIQHVVPVV